jgi:hypothetical protein
MTTHEDNLETILSTTGEQALWMAARLAEDVEEIKTTDPTFARFYRDLAWFLQQAVAEQDGEKARGYIWAGEVLLEKLRGPAVHEPAPWRTRSTCWPNGSRTGEPTHFRTRLQRKMRRFQDHPTLRGCLTGELAIGLYTRPRYTDEMDFLKLPRRGPYNEMPIAHIVRSAERITLFGVKYVPLICPSGLLWWLAQSKGSLRNVANTLLLINWPDLVSEKDINDAHRWCWQTRGHKLPEHFVREAEK